MDEDDTMMRALMAMMSTCAANALGPLVPVGTPEEDCAVLSRAWLEMLTYHVGRILGRRLERDHQFEMLQVNGAVFAAKGLDISPAQRRALVERIDSTSLETALALRDALGAQGASS